MRTTLQQDVFCDTQEWIAQMYADCREDADYYHLEAQSQILSFTVLAYPRFQLLVKQDRAAYASKRLRVLMGIEEYES